MKKRPALSAAKSSSVPSAKVDAPVGEGPSTGGIWTEPVALGLGLLILLRPWRDGLTFVAFNSYFYALVLAVAALWCARGLMRPAALRATVPLTILGAFLGVAWLTGLSGYSHAPADRALQGLAACFLVFAVAANGLRTRRAIAIVLGAVVVGWLLNSLWTIFHYNVMLRGMRQVLKDNPLVMQQYFGTMEPNPELKHRIESNRAFGTFLFPNALGAFAILGLPVLAAALPSARRAFGIAARSETPPRTQYTPWVNMGIVLFTGAVVLVLLSLANELIGLSMPGQKPLIEGTYRPYLFFIPVAGLAGGAAGWFASRHGPRALGLGFMGVAVPVALLSSFIALWLSYSRGAMLGLALASGLTLLLVNAGRLPWGARFTRAAVGAVVLAAALWTAGSPRADDVDGYRVPEPAPSAIEYLQRKHLEVAQEMRTLNIEGMDRRLDSLADPGSLRLRFTYWQVGLRMFFDNFWTGVGVGNYRTAYPKYQHLGAGSAETAHNDYLQAFCETGLFGGALLLAFWVYFAVWGGRRVLTETDVEARRWLAGVYCGILAFALHSVLDFNLQNPSLSLLAYTLAGTFFALTSLKRGDETEPAAQPLRGRLVAAACAVIVFACTAALARVYFFDLGLTEGKGLGRLYQVGDRKPMEARLEAAKIIQLELTDPEKAPTEPRVVQLLGVLRAIPNMAELQAVASFHVPVPDRHPLTRRVGPGEQPPINSLVVFENLPAARALLAKSAEARIEVLKEWDKAYPHDPELAAHIFSWYDMLFGVALTELDKRRYAAEAEHWARTATELSPESFIWWSFYAKALWMRGSLEPGEPGIDFYRTGLRYYRKALELYPTGAAMAFQLAQALQKLGGELMRSGRIDEGQPMVAESAAMYERSVVLDRYSALVR